MFKKLSKQTFLLLIILIIASFFRLYNLGGMNSVPPGLYPDEAMNGNNALEALDAGDFKIFYPENGGREGLFINIQAMFVKVFGNEPWTLRLPSAIIGILTVLGIYLFGATLFNNASIGLLSSFFTAISFWHINFSRIGFRAIMAPAFLVWGIYLLIKSLNQTKNNSQFPIFNFQTNPKSQILNPQNNWKLEIVPTKSRIRDSFGIGRNWILPVLAGLVYGLGFYTYIAYRGTPLLILIIFLIYYFKSHTPVIARSPRHGNLLSCHSRESGNPEDVWEVFKIFLLFAFISLLPFFTFFIQNPQDFFGRTSQLSVFSAGGGSAFGESSILILKNLGINIVKTLGMFNFSGDYNWRHNFAGQPELFWPVGLVFVFGVLYGLWQIIKNLKFKIKNLKLFEFRASGFEFVILFAWCIVAAAPVIVSNEGIPHALRSLLMIPPVFILAGAGAFKLYEILRNKLAGFYERHDELIKNSFILICALLIVQTYNYYFLEWSKNPNVDYGFRQSYVDLGEILNSLPKDTMKYVVIMEDGDVNPVRSRPAEGSATSTLGHSASNGVKVRGIPMPAQTVMFITDTFTIKKQAEKNIYYLLPGQEKDIFENNALFFYLK